MTHDVILGMNRYTADDGNGFIGKDEEGIVQSTELWLGGNSSIDNYLELPLGTEIKKEESMKYSTLSIKRELDKLIREDGISAWKRAKAILQDAEYWDDFILANYLSEQDEVFRTACGALVARNIVTEDEMNELLPKCIWSAD